MIKALYTAASGMLLGLRQQDVVADNLANSSTVAYKADQSAQTAFAGVLAKRVEATGGPIPGRDVAMIGRVGTGAYIENVRTFMGQGPERETGVSTDVMINGAGFFRAQVGDQILYTRDGHFDRDDQQQLITVDGALILDENSNPIVVPTDHIRIRPDGSIYELVTTETPQIDGSTSISVEEQFIAQLGVVTLNTDTLVRAGSSKFTTSDGVETPVVLNAAGTFILQGSLEEANVNVAQTATQLYSVSRSFSSSQRVFAEISRSLETAVTELGRL